jgi:hypothetical protein
MRLAHNPHRLVSLLALLTALGTRMVAQELTTPVLDLTKPTPREQQLSAVPAISVGGVEGESLKSGYLLPLKVELTSISPQPLKAGEKFTLEVLLRNTGASVFLLPASRNGVAVLQHESKGRRSFAFNLIFEDSKSGRQTSSVAAVAVGAETVKNSLLPIAPGKEVRVLFTGDLRPIADWLGHDLGRIQIRAGVSESRFEDRRYFLESQSQPVVSDNTEDINLTER